MSWNSKPIGKLLLIITMADPERFTFKGKSITYIGAFVELYNWRNHEQVHEIYGMIQLEKMCASIAKNPHNLGVHQIIEISSVLYSAHVVPRDQDKVVFYVNNYIDWDQFNLLYDPNWIEKGIRNTDAVARKFGPDLTRATNQKLEVVREERQKRKKIVERRKTEAIVAKRQRVRRGISLFSEEKENYESDTGDEMDINQADDNKNLLQL